MEAVAGTAQATEIPGLYKLSVTTNLAEDPIINYWVQTPPEYDPYRRYPCIVTLNGAATTPLQQIDWWAGGYSKEAQTRYGAGDAAWLYRDRSANGRASTSSNMNVSAREHAAVLLPLRDACKRFAIDVDRVFLTGPFDGRHGRVGRGSVASGFVGWPDADRGHAAAATSRSMGKRQVRADVFRCGEKDSGDICQCSRIGTSISSEARLRRDGRAVSGPRP